MKQKKRKRDFNDLLIPIILVLAVLPFVVRLISYDTGLSDFSWFSEFDIAQDFFTYYRSYLFLIISIVSLFILIPYFLIQKEQRKDLKVFFPLGIYALFAILSTIFSINTKSSLMGASEHFESIFILLGYLIMLVYTYLMNKRDEDYRSLLRAFVLSIILLSLIGFLQMIGKDLFFNETIQKLIIPSSDWKAYIGNIKSYLSNNAVSLTLFNPNYACVYLAMVIPFLLVIIIPMGQTTTNKNSTNLSKVERIVIAIVLVIVTILLYKTYSRSGLLALLASLILLVFINHKFLLNRWKLCTIIGISAIILFIGFDYMNDFRYIHKLTGTIGSFYDKDNQTFDEILTSKQGVSFNIDEAVITVTLSEPKDGKATLDFKDTSSADISDRYDIATGRLNYPPFEAVTFHIKKSDSKIFILCKMNNITWRFYQDEELGYLYLNDFNKSVTLNKINHLGIKGIEDVGSGRGYIWSRSIPLLKDSLIVGTGPDTFLYAFPQSDYVGKANNCKTPVTLIEKPHSFYLMMGIQTGVISVVAFLIFYIIYLLHSIRIYRKIDLSSLKVRIGLGCFLATFSFMISGFFNDSSIQTTPVFMILLGLGLDINYQLDTLNKPKKKR